MSCQIIPVKGHYEVYIDGKFYCSADSFSEAQSEIADYQGESEV